LHAQFGAPQQRWGDSAPAGLRRAPQIVLSNSTAAKIGLLTVVLAMGAPIHLIQAIPFSKSTEATKR
jgi:hypothetical protein